jgi:hypothetical protein
VSARNPLDTKKSRPASVSARNPLDTKKSRPASVPARNRGPGVRAAPEGGAYRA